MTLYGIFDETALFARCLNLRQVHIIGLVNEWSEYSLFFPSTLSWYKVFVTQSERALCSNEIRCIIETKQKFLSMRKLANNNCLLMRNVTFEPYQRFESHPCNSSFRNRTRMGSVDVVVFFFVIGNVLNLILENSIDYFSWVEFVSWDLSIVVWICQVQGGCFNPSSFDSVFEWNTHSDFIFLTFFLSFPEKNHSYIKHVIKYKYCALGALQTYVTIHKWGKLRYVRSE